MHYTTSHALLLAMSWREKLACMSWLELVLWIGLATLTLALLVLVGTRWGQVRPVSKCVVLSVFAHLLFLCYAYGTSLSFGGSLSGDPFVRVSYIAPDELDENSATADENSSFNAEIARDPAEEPADEASPPMPQDESPAPSLASPPPEVRPPDFADPAEMITNAESSPALLPDPTATPEPAEEQPPSESPTESVPISEIANEASLPADVTPEVIPQQPSEIAASQDEPTSNLDSTTTAAEPLASQPGETNNEPAEVPRDVAAAGRAPMLRPVDGQPVPDAYSLRVTPDRLRFALSFGATESSEAAVAAALEWLAAQQQSDGRWDASEFGAGRETRTLGQDRRGAGADADTGISGLALLAFLGAGHTHIEGRYRDTVQHGLEFLLRSQMADGSLVGSAKDFEKMYCHGIALIAIGEAYALSGDTRLLSGLRQGVRYTLAAQDRVSGGWRYRPGDRGDMSQCGWQVMALRSAELGGLEIPADTRALAHKFLESVAQGKERGLASYRPGERATRTMTAEAMACRFILDLPAEALSVAEGSDFLLQELPGQDESNLYYWYYATLSLFQTQGQGWEVWNQALQQHLVATQCHDGLRAGSWDTRDVWGGYGGRLYTTAMAALCLEVYYRYLPIYDPANSLRHADASRGINGVRR